MATVSLVALDLGGVIVEVDHAAPARVLGVESAVAEAAFFGGAPAGADGWHDELTCGRLSPEEFLARAAERLGRGLADVRRAWQAMVQVMPEGRALIEELLARGHAVHLWSNTDPIHLEAMSRELPAGVFADTVSFRLGAQKPSASYWRRARARGQPALYLDDRADFVAEARRAGIEARCSEGPRAARALLVEAGLLRP
jgi:FMN phosphatase YigB (HAD superfamily)